MELQKQKIQLIIKTALVVEDNEVCIKVLYNYLSQLGYQVEVEKEANIGIQCIERKSYSLIVTDLSSAEAVIIAVSQYECNQKTPLIVCTSCDSLEIKRKCLDLGADDYIIKPINHERILEKSIEKCLLVSGEERKLRRQHIKEDTLNLI